MNSPQDQSTREETPSEASNETVPPLDDLKVLWHGTAEGVKVARARKVLWAILITVGFYLGYAVWWNLSDTVWQKILFEILGIVLWFIGCAAAIAIFELSYADPQFNNFQIQLQRQQLLSDYHTDLNASLELRDLWILNQRRLDLYHQIATNQSKSSFKYAQLAAGIGFITIVSAAITVWFSKTTTTAITTGTLGVFGGSLGAYVGGTFMKVQQGAAQQLRQYFGHPLELSKILIAERLIETLPIEQRVEAVQSLTQALFSSQPADSAGEVRDGAVRPPN